MNRSAIAIVALAGTVALGGAAAVAQTGVPDLTDIANLSNQGAAAATTTTSEAATTTTATEDAEATEATDPTATTEPDVAAAETAPLSTPECQALGTGLQTILGVTPETTKTDLLLKLNSTGDLLTKWLGGANDGMVALLKVKTTADIADKAVECGLVTDTTQQDVLGALSSGDLTQLAGLGSSEGSDLGELGQLAQLGEALPALAGLSS